MEELYRGYRIAIKADGKWMARITHVRGNVVPGHPDASLVEGEAVCRSRARQHIDAYIAFLRPAKPDHKD